MSRSTPSRRAAACLALGLLGGLAFGPRLVGQPPVPAPVPAPADGPALPRDWNSYAPVVKRVAPAVVVIEGKTKARPKLDDPDPGFGSGVLIHPAGIVLTCNHLVADATALDVTLADGRKFPAKEIRRDPKTDLAIVRIEDKAPFPFVEFGNSDAMEPGDRVLAFGAPFGLTGSVTQGIVSARGRRNLNVNVVEDFIQFDAAVNPGNSGGPLVSTEGKLIGLTSAIKTRSGGFQGVGLAVSGKLADAVAADLIRNGAVKRPSIGVQVREMDEDAATRNKLKPGGGVVISEVVAKSPGEAANLGVGDVVTSFNGQVVTTPREMLKAVVAAPAGQPVAVVVVRNGQAFQTRVTPVEQLDVAPAAGAVPGPPLQAAMSLDAVGLTVIEVTADAAAKLGLPKGVKAVQVAAVTPNGLAALSGVGRGMLVIQVDRFPVATPDDFRTAVERASREKGAVLHVLRPNGEVDFVVLRGQ
jgi:serine protease Do